MEITIPLRSHDEVRSYKDLFDDIPSAKPDKEMIGIAVRHRPHAACIVPEKREDAAEQKQRELARREKHLESLKEKP